VMTIWAHRQILGLRPRLACAICGVPKANPTLMFAGVCQCQPRHWCRLAPDLRAAHAYSEPAAEAALGSLSGTKANVPSVTDRRLSKSGPSPRRACRALSSLLPFRLRGINWAEPPAAVQVADLRSQTCGASSTRTRRRLLLPRSPSQTSSVPVCVPLHRPFVAFPMR